MRRCWLALIALLLIAAGLSLLTPLSSILELQRTDPALAWMLI